MKNDDGQGAQIGFEYQAEIDVDLTNWRFHKVHFFSFSLFFFPPFFPGTTMISGFWDHV